MSCEIIAVGTELLLGDIVNTNAQYISRGLSEIGIDVYFQTVVGDNPARLKSAIELASRRAEVIITTGGLGPTADDLTKETIAAVFGKKLVFHPECWKEIEKYFACRDIAMPENNRKQAMLPEDCIVLDNPQGTAPGCIIEKGSQALIMMPGPPREMKPMFDNLVKPYLGKYSKSVMVSRVIRVMGLGESAMEEKLRDLMDSANPTVAPYAKTGECLVRITAKAGNQEEAEALIAPVAEAIHERLGKYAYADNVDSPEEYIIGKMLEKKLTLGIADAYTRGLALSRLLSIEGAAPIVSGTCAPLSCFIDGKELTLESIKEQVLGIASQAAGKFQAKIGLAIIGFEDNIYAGASLGERSSFTKMQYPFKRDKNFAASLAVNKALALVLEILEKLG